MEEADKYPQEAPEPSVLSESQDAKNDGVCTQDVDEWLKGESTEGQPEEEEKLIVPQRPITLQRDLTTLVTNIQTAADAKESMRRKELEEARRIRLERLENNAKSSQELFEEITRGWLIAKQKVIPQELQEALNNQQRLCDAIIEDKKKLINELQQELKVQDDRFVKDLRKQAEELDLMMERMEDQIKTLAKAYREELAQMERVYHQESKILLTRDKTEWEQHMKELWDKELERLAQRKKNVEEYEETVHNLMLETVAKFSLARTENNAKDQIQGREAQKMKANNMITKLKLIKQKDEKAVLTFNLTHMKSRICSLQKVMTNLKAKYSSQTKQFAKKRQSLSKDYERSIQQYERLQKKINHFAGTDVKQFEDMWLMIEAEVKQLVERVLVIDSLICKQHLGIAWERPPLEFMKSSGPIQPQKHTLPSHQASSQVFHTGQALQCSQRMMDLSGGPRLETDTERTDMEGTEVEEGKLSMETLKKVMELLCDEAGFLMENKLLNLLAPLEKEEQAVVKLASLLCSFGIEEEDVPKLAGFLLKYKQEEREQPENVCAESINKADKVESTSNLIHPNHVLPALKSFLQQHMKSRERSAHQHHSFHVAARDTSEDKAYWDSLGNIITEDKMKLWDATENALKQYQAVLTDISELVPETQSLKQQNAELRMLLHQSLNSTVGPDLEMP